MMKRPPEPAVSLKGQLFFLVLGLVPLFMLIEFWFKSGTGLNPSLVGFVFLDAGAFLAALNYYFFYSQNKPRSAIVPPGPVKGGAVAAVLGALGAYNMMAIVSGVSLTLSPGPKMENPAFGSLLAKVLLMKPVPVLARYRLDFHAEPWLISSRLFHGSLWGALGYALAFGLAGALFALLRKEVLDPRDEHLGAGMVGAFTRGAIGLFYGTSMGFAVGMTVIFIVCTLAPNFNALPAPLLHWIYVLGAAQNPNTAFTYAFSTASVLAAAMSLFLGKRDFTASISDPKAPELTRPVEIVIPAVPAPPQMAFDMSRMQQESQQIMQQFGAELQRTFGSPDWNYERYDVPPIGTGAHKPEVEATNLISARSQEEDSYDTAMGPLSNVYVQIVADLGKLELSAMDFLTLGEGAMLELPKAQDSAINVSINGKLVGRGRALTVNGNKAVKVLALKGDVQQLLNGA